MFNCSIISLKAAFKSLPIGWVIQQQFNAEILTKGKLSGVRCFNTSLVSFLRIFRCAFVGNLAIVSWMLACCQACNRLSTKLHCLGAVVKTQSQKYNISTRQIVFSFLIQHERLDDDASSSSRQFYPSLWWVNLWKFDIMMSYTWEVTLTSLIRHSALVTNCYYINR